MTENSQMIVELSGGNPGALQVLATIIAQADDEQEIAVIFRMMKLCGLSGAAIWMRFKDECGQDIRAFIRSVIEEVANNMQCREKIPAGRNEP